MVNVPQDTRWGDLGGAIGNIVGTFAAAKRKKDIEQGVSNILNDRSMDPSQKRTAILARYGAEGLQSFKDIQEGIKLDEEIKKTGAETQAYQASTARDIEATTEAKAEAPLKRALTTAQTERETQESKRAAVETSLLPGKTAAEEERDRAEATHALAEAMAVKKTQAKTLEEIIPPETLKTMSPAKRAAAQAAINVGKPEKIPEIVASEERASLISEPDRKQVEASASMRANLQGEADAIKEGKAGSGGPGSVLTNYLSHWGVASGTPEFNAEQTRLNQMVIANLRTGGNMLGKAFIDVTKETTPGSQQTPLRRLMEVHTIAEDALARYQTMKKIYANSGADTTAIDDEIAGYEKTVADTRLTTDEYNNVYYNGAIVDPHQLKPVNDYMKNAYDPKQTLSGANGVKKSGAWINEQAKEAGVSPQTFYEAWSAGGGG